MQKQLLRGSILSFSAPPPAQPASTGSDQSTLFIEDGVVQTESGHIRFVGSLQDFIDAGGNPEHCEDLRPGLLVPGFIDNHIHYSQMSIIASYGTQLLDWLERYAFPAELAFSDPAHAEEQAEQFLNWLFRFGTTTALTFTTTHPCASDALFAAAHAKQARLIAGKVLMDRNAPDGLLDKDTGQSATRALIERWHGSARLSYAITPRFAITCTEGQLSAAAELLKQYPDLYLHTHLAEHPDEIAATLELFPTASDYVDVYDRFDMLTPRSLFAHGIHLSDRELTRLSETGSSIVFCPTSNLFLGSGLLELDRLAQFGVGLAVGSDVGGGTAFSMLATLADGYKVNQLNGESWHPLRAIDAITRGNAAALGMAEKIGQIAPGFEADITVLRPRGESLLNHRLRTANTLEERLFAYIFLGGDDAIARTYVNGQLQYQRLN